MRQKTQAGPEDSSERKSRDAQDKKCIFKRQSCQCNLILDKPIYMWYKYLVSLSYIGDWSSGMIGVSKTFGGSSILSSPAL